MQEIIGRTDLLSQVSRGDAALDDLDLNPILVQAIAHGQRGGDIKAPRVEVPDTLDAQIVKDAATALETGGKMQLSYNIENTQRAIGTRLSSHLVRRFGMTGLPESQINVRLRGPAGQSLGAFAVQGLRLDVIGDANDYVGKGLSGGTITVRPSVAASFVAAQNTIIGNTVLYGATSGTLLAAGQAGERLCVRNSGALAIVEGCGSNGCEYMTGGQAVILGEVGSNFGAGMTGGMAFIYDEASSFMDHVNKETLHISRIHTDYWADHLNALIVKHANETESEMAKSLLNNWMRSVGHFWHVVPKEILTKLPHALGGEDEMRHAS